MWPGLMPRVPTWPMKFSGVKCWISFSQGILCVCLMTIWLLGFCFAQVFSWTRNKITENRKTILKKGI